MRIIAPVNFEDASLGSLRTSAIDSVYADIGDCMRGGFFLPPGSPEAACITALMESNIRVIFSWESVCFNNAEFTRRGRKIIAGILDRLVQAKAYALTLGSPYLVEIVKRGYPGLKIGISPDAHVDSLRRAQFWDDMGVDFINLPAETMNRDFKMIAALHDCLRCELYATVNSACFNACPYFPYRERKRVFRDPSFDVDRSASGERDVSCCRDDPVSRPEYSLSRSCWIRPEDADFYAALGIDAFVLLGKEFSNGRLAALIKAYADKRFDGNLSFLLSGECPERSLDARWRERFFIENKKLGGFVEALAAINCREKECAACGYCFLKTREAVRLNERLVPYDA